MCFYGNMHEVRHEGDRQQRLIGLLRADFTSPESERLAREAQQKRDPLAGLLSHARGVEDIDERLASDENVELGERVMALLAPAAVTESFKGFIAGQVRRAHAWQDRVDSVVAPDRLGLTSGDGIFDPLRAKEIEGQTIRGRAFDILHRYTYAARPESAADLPPLVLQPSTRPRDYVEAVDEFTAWGADYKETYDEDAFEGVEGETLLAAVPFASFDRIIERLEDLRDDKQEE
jgi:hypothetical protein